MGSMRKSRLSKYKQGRLVEHFVAGTTARTAASLCLRYAHIFRDFVPRPISSVPLYFYSFKLTERDSVTPNSFKGRWPSYVGRIGKIWGSAVR